MTKKDRTRLSPRKLFSKIVHGQVVPAMVSAVIKCTTNAWEMLRRWFRTQAQPIFETDRYDY